MICVILLSFRHVQKARVSKTIITLVQNRKSSVGYRLRPKRPHSEKRNIYIFLVELENIFQKIKTAIPGLMKKGGVTNISKKGNKNKEDHWYKMKRKTTVIQNRF